MRKGERTRSAILERAVELFNTRGIAGVSLADVMSVTGLQKGGIYNHFESKEQLALAAFDYAIGHISRLLWSHVKAHRAPLDRLNAIFNFFHAYYQKPPFKGGCVILNATIEGDDANPVLLHKARQTMDLWRKLVRQTLERGIADGSLDPALDAETTARIIISTLQGGYSLMRLYDDFSYVQQAIDHLRGYVANNMRRA